MITIASRALFSGCSAFKTAYTEGVACCGNKSRMKLGCIEGIYGKTKLKTMEHKNTFFKGRAEQIPVVRRGRPCKGGSYRQRLFGALDTLEILEYLEIEPVNHDKAIAYCQQKNTLAQDKRFVAVTIEGGVTRIFRKN